MEDFEWKLTAALNQFFESEGTRAVAYRLKQSRYTSQVVDILVDSPHHQYYLAIECKSLNARKAKTLYFSQHFSEAGGKHQIKRANEFLLKSGRKGILAVELRRGPGKPKTAHMVPWSTVINKYSDGLVGLELEEIEESLSLERTKGNYEITRLDEILL